MFTDGIALSTDELTIFLGFLVICCYFISGSMLPASCVFLRLSSSSNFFRYYWGLS